VNTCDTRATLHLDAKGVRLEGEDKAIVRVSLGKLGAVTKAVVYEDGEWRHDSDASVKAWYGKTADQIIAMRKAAGDCS
ncbi:MAG: hypothetical protein M3Y71_09880, partial [Actinomycetota bacterium]|nr:hypothetical protein [Actinomycetota bacterium]